MKDKSYYVDHTNIKWIAKWMRTDEEINRVIEYLKKYNVKIKCTPTSDSQSGYEGEHVLLQGRNLSFNGYHFGPDELINHMDNFAEMKKRWDEKDYKLYYELKQQYKEVDKFFNL